MPSYLYEIRQSLELLLDPRARKGKVDGTLATTTFGDGPLAVFENDYFNSWWGHFFKGTHKDIDFLVSDFAKTSGIVTFGPALAVATDTTDEYELIPPDYSPVELLGAINEAIRMVSEEALENVVDESVQVASDTYEYTVPDGLLYISQIYQKESSGKVNASQSRIDEMHWRILSTAPRKIWFDSRLVDLAAGRVLRIEGQKAASTLTLDADQTGISHTFLVYQAKANLHLARASNTDDDHGRKMAIAQAIADRERRKLLVAGRGRRAAA